MNMPRCGSLALCTLFFAAMGGVLPRLHQAESPHAAPSKSVASIVVTPEVKECANFLPYATDPTHMWNRVHRQLFERRDIKGQTWGCDEVDPLLWQRSKHVLEIPAYQETVRLLDEFTSTHAERLIRDPLTRALFQRDLWAVFDWLGSLTDDHPQQRAELERRLAVIIKAVALTQSEIHGLPANYSQVRGSTTSDGLALPDKAGGWLLIGRDDGMPPARSHTLFFSRSMFLVYLKLAPGGVKARKYLEAMRAYGRERPKTDDCQQNPCSPPQFPVGTELALVRRAILMDAAGHPVVSPITESVQLRRYIRIPPGTRFDFDGNAQQQVAEFQLTRSKLREGTIGLRVVGKDETQYPVFMTHGIDVFEESGAGTETARAVLRTCRSCHQGVGVISFATYSRVQFDGKKDLFVPVHISTEAKQAAAAIRFLQAHDKWRLLQKLLQGHG